MYIPGLCPDPDQRCPGCKQSLLVINSERTPGENDDLLHRSHATHILACVKRIAADKDKGKLLLKYPYLFRDPFKVKSKHLPANAKNYYTTASGRLVRASNSHRILACIDCPTPGEQFQVNTIEEVRLHLLMKHDVWFPTPTMAKHMVSSATDWDPQLISIPCDYDFERGEAITDPQVAEGWYANLYKRRILAVTVHTKNYGIRPDIDVSDDQLSEDRFSAPPDFKYLFVKRKARPLEQFGVCFFCVHNPALPWTERLRLANTLGHQQAHLVLCSRAAVNGIHLHQETLRDIQDSDLGQSSEETPGEHPFFCGSAIACPDPVCRANRRVHRSSLELFQHLVAVHQVEVLGRRSKADTVHLSTLTSLTFDSDSDLRKWASAKGKSRARKGKAKARESVSLVDASEFQVLSSMCSPMRIRLRLRSLTPGAWG